MDLANLSSSPNIAKPIDEVNRSVYIIAKSKQVGLLHDLRSMSTVNSEEDNVPVE
jgi:hypothetical protein